MTLKSQQLPPPCAVKGFATRASKSDWPLPFGPSLLEQTIRIAKGGKRESGHAAPLLTPGTRHPGTIAQHTNESTHKSEGPIVPTPMPLPCAALPNLPFLTPKR